MKKNIVIFAALILGLVACKEQSPIIPPLGPPSTNGKKVFIEEFTGVRCVNCPNGSAQIENLQGLYGDNLIAVSIHAGFFSDPYPESVEDFRTQDGDDLQMFLGEPEGYPSAVIDRKLFANNTTLQVGLATWAAFIQAQAAPAPSLGLNISNSYNPSTRQVTATVTMVPSKNLANDLNLTLMLTESGIVDLQETPDGLKTNYVHKHALRKVITGVQGDAISEPLNEGVTIQKTYTYTLPEKHVAEKCNIIALVHRNGSTLANKEVLQVDEAHVTE